MEMYIDTSAYSMAKGKLQLYGATQAIRIGHAQLPLLHDSVAKRLSGMVPKSSEVFTFSEVYSLLHMGQTYGLKTWVIAQASSSWLLGEHHMARLGYIDRIMQVGRAIYVYLVFYPELDLRNYWVSAQVLNINDDVFHVARIDTGIHDIASLAITCLKLRNGASRTRIFQVQRSST